MLEAKYCHDFECVNTDENGDCVYEDDLVMCACRLCEHFDTCEHCKKKNTCKKDKNVLSNIEEVE